MVHAKGAGAHGYFISTKDMSTYTKASIYTGNNKKTKIFARFSTIAGELGSPDLAVDARGFAIKHYTPDGNYDLLTLSGDVFPLHDPMKLADFVHSNKKDPRTGLPDVCNRWDFTSHHPETLNENVRFWSDYGLTDGYVHTNWFAISTYKWVNSKGEVHFVRYHLITDQGLKLLTRDEQK